MNSEAAEWIVKLGLRPHTEGGFYREIYRSPISLPAKALPMSFESSRVLATAITYLLPADQVSHIHRLRGDEMWFFHAGSSLTLHVFCQQSGYDRYGLGLNAEKGERPQILMKAGWWFGAAVDEPDSYTLAACCVAPGFEFDDFEPGDRDQIMATWPEHAELIERLTPSLETDTMT